MLPDHTLLPIKLEPGIILDGYCLLRPIGRGGFGEVWLCQLKATSEFKALKFLPASNAAQLNRELEALIRYRTVADALRAPHLLPIEHVNRTDSGLFYTMPLADGLASSNPTDPAWRPKTLASLIQEQKDAPKWFDADEIREIILPLLRTVQQLSDAGILHRDIKPDNILFVQNRACLGDISLLSNDAQTLTQRGTPGYASPSWYLESGGNPDLWGMATTLYTLVTGNAPDKLGRGMFLWPPQGEASVQRKDWNLFHQIILRATHEKPSERFLRIDAMGAALQSRKVKVSLAQKVRAFPWRGFIAACVLMGLGLGWWHLARISQSAPKLAIQTVTEPTPTASTRPTVQHSEPDLAERQMQEIRVECDAILTKADAIMPAHVPEMRRAMDKLAEFFKKLDKEEPLPMDELKTVFERMEQLIPVLTKEFKAADNKHVVVELSRLLVKANESFSKKNGLPLANPEKFLKFAYVIQPAFKKKQALERDSLFFTNDSWGNDFFLFEWLPVRRALEAAESNAYIMQIPGRKAEIEEIKNRMDSIEPELGTINRLRLRE